MTTLTKDELNSWYLFRTQLVNGWHIEKSDLQELIRLNHLVMEAAHDIHNKNMINELK